MLKIMMLRKKLQTLQDEETALRARQLTFKTREGELAAQIEAAKTEEEVSAVSAAVEELEKSQKTTKERLQTIKDECDAILDEIAAAEEAAAAAGAGDDTGNDDGSNDGSSEARSRRTSGAAWIKRCKEFQRTGHMVYENAHSLVKRAAVTTGSAGVVGPTGVGQINDLAGNTVSGLIDLVKITDCTGMSSYKVPYEASDPEAADFTDGQAPGESEPTFGSVELTPKLVGLLAYISREIRKQSPALYEEKVQESVRRALRRKLNSKAVTALLASSLNSTLALTGATGAELFTPHLLSDIILSYGGDEGVDGVAHLILNKLDLKAFAAVRGTNEYLPVYSITPDPANPSLGTIKDNNGLSCRYCLSKDVTALSAATLNGTAKKTMVYGNPQCLEMALWGGVEVNVNEGYKFGEGLLSIRGEVMSASDVTVKNGFVVVTAKTAG